MNNSYTNIKRININGLPHSVWNNTAEHSYNHIPNLIKLSPELGIRKINIMIYNISKKFRYLQLDSFYTKIMFTII